LVIAGFAAGVPGAIAAGKGRGGSFGKQPVIRDLEVDLVENR
jgi:hypothetical protein